MQLSQTEENYIKVIFSLSERNESFETSAAEIATKMNTKPPSVSDMLRKLIAKKLVAYQKYKKVVLTKTGKHVAIQIIRKHRLWEVFLHEKLNFSWDEVHELAEQLEHIHSEKLTQRLEKFLGFPQYDPHGDPIPSANGEYKEPKRSMLSEIDMGLTCQMVGVKDSSTDFLQYLHQMNVGIGSKIKVLEKIAFDNSLVVSFKKGHQVTVSKKFADNVLVTC